jgi:hypothetical protein
MAFLHNRTINLLNLHYGLHAFAQGMGGAFVLVFLVRAGLSAPAALLAMGAILGGRFFIRPAVLVFARRFGLKPAVIAGIVVVAAHYPILAYVDGIGLPLIAFCLVASLGETFYWSAYHAYFAALGDREHRGHQTGAREATAAIASIVAPLAGAWSLVTLGSLPAFAAVGLVELLGAAPLLRAPNIAVAPHVAGAYRAALPGVRLFIADGWLTVMSLFVWQLLLFGTLDQSFAAYGDAMALAALVGAVSGLVLGRHIDLGHGHRVVGVACLVVAATLLLRATAVGTPWLAVTAHAAGALATCLYVPVLMTAIYNLSQAAPCPLRFQIATESGWDLGSAAGCVVTAALAAYAPALSPAVVLGLLGMLGLAAVTTLLLRYYAGLAGAVAQPAPIEAVPVAKRA